MISGRFADMLEKRLSLSAEQKEKVKKILSEAKAGLKAKFDAVRKAHEEMQATEKETRGKVRETLTDEQKKLFDELRPRGPRGPGMEGGMQGPGGRQGGMRQRRGGPGMQGGPGGMPPQEEQGGGE